MFHHEAGPQALIQFRTSQEAEDVKKVLQSQVFHIDNNVITFEVQFSKFTDLRVNQNNKFSWDFTEGTHNDHSSPELPDVLSPIEVTASGSFSPEPSMPRPGTGSRPPSSMNSRQSVTLSRGIVYSPSIAMDHTRSEVRRSATDSAYLDISNCDYIT